MGTSTLPIQVALIDYGVDAHLTTWPDGGRVLIVRPWPAQTFEAATAAAARVLGCPEGEARALLRDYFPTTALPDLPTLPAAGQSPGDQAVRARIRRDESRMSLFTMVALGLIALTIGWAMSLLLLPRSGATPPLNRPAVTDALTAWGVRCGSNTGWEASCYGSVTGSFRLRAGLFGDDILVTSTRGFQSVYMYLIPNDVTAAAMQERLGNLPDLTPTDVVWLRGDPNIIMWGDEDLVPQLIVKGLELGWVQEPSRTLPGSPVEPTVLGGLPR